MAVFTPVSEQEVHAFLRAYAVGGLRSMQGVSEGVENTNYRLECDGGVFVLTLFEKRTPPESLPYCLALTEYAGAHGSPTPAPQRTRDGALLSTLADRPAALLRWLPGRWSAEPTTAAAETAGQALGAFHLAGAGFPLQRDNPYGPTGWRVLIDRCAGRGDSAEQGVLAQLDREVAELTASWPSDLPKGAIHADFFPDNVLFSGGAVTGVIDLYFACTDALAYDLAIALNAWGFSLDGTPDAARLAAFARGYQSVRRLSDAEVAALPRLCRGAAVRFTLTRLHDRLFHDASWLVTPHDPAPFFRRLEFHRGWEERALALRLTPLETLAVPEPQPSRPPAPPRAKGSARADPAAG